MYLRSGRWPPGPSRSMELRAADQEPRGLWDHVPSRLEPRAGLLGSNRIPIPALLLARTCLAVSALGGGRYLG